VTLNYERSVTNISEVKSSAECPTA